jgi:hypothetical protein
MFAKILSTWTSYGRSPRLGIRRAYKRTRVVRTPNDMRSIFARLGLGGDFWDPQSDSFNNGLARFVLSAVRGSPIT